MQVFINRWRAQRAPALFAAALLLFALGVLWPGFRLAERLDDTTAALKALRSSTGCCAR